MKAWRDGVAAALAEAKAAGVTLEELNAATRANREWK